MWSALRKCGLDDTLMMTDGPEREEKDDYDYVESHETLLSLPEHAEDSQALCLCPHPVSSPAATAQTSHSSAHMSRVTH